MIQSTSAFRDVGGRSIERNQRRIAADRLGESKAGAPREGASLLQVLVLCRRCGRVLKLQYTHSRCPRYVGMNTSRVI